MLANDQGYCPQPSVASNSGEQGWRHMALICTSTSSRSTRPPRPGAFMFQITGAFAEFERSMIRQRVRAGLKRAVESGKQLGRPKIDPSMEKRIQAQLRAKKGMLAIARDLKVGTGTVQRIKREMEARGPFDGAAAA